MELTTEDLGECDSCNEPAVVTYEDGSKKCENHADIVSRDLMRV